MTATGLLENQVRICHKCGAEYSAEVHYCAGCGIGLPGKQATQVPLEHARAAALFIAALPAPPPSRQPELITRWGLRTKVMNWRVPAAVLGAAAVLYGAGALLPFTLELMYGKSETFIIGFMDMFAYSMAPLALGLILLWKVFEPGRDRSPTGLTMEAVVEFLAGHLLVRCLGALLGSVLMIIGFVLSLKVLWMIGATGSPPAVDALKALPGGVFLLAGCLLCRCCLRET